MNVSISISRRGQTTCFSTYDISQMKQTHAIHHRTTHDYITNSMFACMFSNNVHTIITRTRIGMYLPSHLSFFLYPPPAPFVFGLFFCVYVCVFLWNKYSTKLSDCDFQGKLFNVIQIMTLILYGGSYEMLLWVFICNNNNHSLTRAVIKTKLKASMPM